MRQMLAGFFIVACLPGCPDPNTYGTPRTLAPGDFQVQASYGGFAAAAHGSGALTPGLPSIGFRAGLADRIDVGARVVSLTALGGDAKLNFVRGRVDLALDPMVQGFWGIQTVNSFPPIATVEFHLPLLVGINFNDATTLVITPGLVASASTSSAAAYMTPPTPIQTAFTTSGVGGRLGLGLNVHQSDTFSWQPEVTAWHEFNSTDVWFCVFGIGMSIGNQPDYSDLAPSQ
jgi:hypothetical protein